MAGNTTPRPFCTSWRALFSLLTLANRLINSVCGTILFFCLFVKLNRDLTMFNADSTIANNSPLVACFKILFCLLSDLEREILFKKSIFLQILSPILRFCLHIFWNKNSQFFIFGVFKYVCSESHYWGRNRRQIDHQITIII